ncbi:MAG TPA: hypothetical protein DDW52_20820, partial [Planctomycetaceae bacterium]|nr:hypothetical protein [Planctomycetaceae bacterium]
MTTAGIDLALSLVQQHFCGVADKDGVPYSMHCLRVMNGVECEKDIEQDAQIVALLHDLVEDTPVTLDDLVELGFNPRIVEALELVTHAGSQTYGEYVIRIKPNPIARVVKLADLRENAGLDRVLLREGNFDTDTRRIQRYILSY